MPRFLTPQDPERFLHIDSDTPLTVNFTPIADHSPNEFRHAYLGPALTGDPLTLADR